MNTLSRRQLLRHALVGASALALPLRARPAVPPVGGPQIVPLDCILPVRHRVLEIFLKGGFDPWRSFWVEPTFRDLESEPVWTDFTVQPPDTSVPGLHADTLGPAAHPLAGTSLMERCRVAVMHHDLEPHEAAVPYAITGTRLGRPSFASLAAAVNAARGNALKSFVIDGGHAESAGYASHPGSFGAAYRPPVIRVGDPTFIELLERGGVQTFDDVERLLGAAYSSRLVHPQTSPERVRSRAVDAYDGSASLMYDRHEELAALLAATSLGEAPAVQTWTDNFTRVGVRVGAELLAHADYVCVIDAGVYRQYDTHDRAGAATDQAGNLWNLCSILAELAGEGRLDNVLVLLNTEFGRLELNGAPSGTEHWPYAYVNVLMGAPFSSVRHRGGIDTTVDPDRFGFATEGGAGRGPYRPQDVRAVLADYLAVDPSILIDANELSEDVSVLRSELIEGDPCV